MHPSEEIYCEKSKRLRGKTIVIGITGSIAATECFTLIRELIRNGAKIIPVMTLNATKLVAPDSIEFACGMKPIVELGGSGRTYNIFGMCICSRLVPCLSGDREYDIQDGDRHR